MRADVKVIKVSLSDVPAVAIYERDRGLNVTVMYVLVRTDYEESDKDAVVRAQRIAKHYTDELSIRKSSKIGE